MITKTVKTIKKAPVSAETTKEVANKVIEKAITTKKFTPKATVKKALEKQYIKLNRNDAIAECESAVLFAIKDIAVWINKKGLYPSEYTNKVDAAIVIEWTYNYIGLEDALNNADVEQEQITGQELFTYFLDTQE